MKKMLLMGLFGLSAAQAAPLPVSATTTIIGDFVRVVGGARVKVNVIVPAGGDTHTFQPSTGVIRSLSGSRLLFANGAGLEPWLPKLRAAAPGVPVKALTAGLKLHKIEHHGEADHAGHSQTHSHGEADPHAWWDPELAAGYVRNVQVALSALDPAGKATYANNAAAYLRELRAVDAAARAQFAKLPASRRNIVTNHDALASFAAHYGLEVVGAVIPGLSTEREPSARELAGLVQAVKKSGARAIFTDNTANTRLAQTLAREMGVRVAPPLYTDSLGPKGSAGDTYLRALKHNVATVVGALR